MSGNEITVEQYLSCQVMAALTEIEKGDITQLTRDRLLVVQAVLAGNTMAVENVEAHVRKYNEQVRAAK